MVQVGQQATASRPASVKEIERDIAHKLQHAGSDVITTTTTTT
eukprot:CAMPEP_0115096678 /NCGR_PEP_ID=MMETSP0227-20121206/29894_1 /TAXON_ID=89957 /ORGANISM="Polarella glacialis, Strain CCMP 1383" /LENGTH=42 /DNA_ID= /DNA_START= /DNA_END= /DNA_ORIENTATION=